MNIPTLTQLMDAARKAFKPPENHQKLRNMLEDIAGDVSPQYEGNLKVRAYVTEHETLVNGYLFYIQHSMMGNGILRIIKQRKNIAISGIDTKTGQFYIQIKDERIRESAERYRLAYQRKGLDVQIRP